MTILYWLYWLYLIQCPHTHCSSWWHLQASKELPLESRHRFALDLQDPTAIQLWFRDRARSITEVLLSPPVESAETSSPNLQPGAANVEVDVFGLRRSGHLPQQTVRVLVYSIIGRTSKLPGRTRVLLSRTWIHFASFNCSNYLQFLPSKMRDWPWRGSAEHEDFEPSESSFLPWTSLIQFASIDREIYIYIIDREIYIIYIHACMYVLEI